MTPCALPDAGLLLTVKQVARRLAISVRTVWRHTRAGYLPAPRYPIPRAPRWLVTELEACLARRESHHA